MRSQAEQLLEQVADFEDFIFAWYQNSNAQVISHRKGKSFTPLDILEDHAKPLQAHLVHSILSGWSTKDNPYKFTLVCFEQYEIILFTLDKWEFGIVTMQGKVHDIARVVLNWLHVNEESQRSRAKEDFEY